MKLQNKGMASGTQNVNSHMQIATTSEDYFSRNKKSNGNVTDLQSETVAGSSAIDSAAIIHRPYGNDPQIAFTLKAASSSGDTNNIR